MDFNAYAQGAYSILSTDTIWGLFIFAVCQKIGHTAKINMCFA